MSDNMYMFSSKKRVFITGGNGLVGRALQKNLKECQGWVDVYAPTSEEVDLRNYGQLVDAVSRYEPDFIIHLAAKVGGLFYNQEYQGDMLRDNLLMNTNVLNAAKCIRSVKLINMLSSCIYPKQNYVTYPLVESDLHIGPPHDSNYGYAYAKRMLDIQSRAYVDSYRMHILNLVPTNIFGKDDHFGQYKAHVIPSLMYSFHEASKWKATIQIKGTGRALRQFTYADNIAKYINFCLNQHWNGYNIFNIGSEEEISIKKLVSELSKITDFSGKIEFTGREEEDGQIQKPISTDKFKEWSKGYERVEHNFEKELLETYDRFKEIYE